MAKLNTERLNKWLSPLANVGVVAGIVILVLEVRQTNELTMAQIEQSRSELFVQWHQQTTTNDYIAPLQAKIRQLRSEYPNGLDDNVGTQEIEKRVSTILAQLDPVEQIRAEAMVTRGYWDFEGLFFQYRRGLVSDSYWNKRIAPAIIGQAPVWKGALGGRLPGGRPEFNEEVERLLRSRD